VRIEVLYVDDCPGHAELRERLPRLLEAAGLRAEIAEIRIGGDRQARAARFPGSPTVRVNGRDVDATAAGPEAGYGLCCRLYATDEGLAHSPPDELILAALGA
jgi:hypothetical protein